MFFHFRIAHDIGLAHADNGMIHVDNGAVSEVHSRERGMRELGFSSSIYYKAASAGGCDQSENFLWVFFLASSRQLTETTKTQIIVSN